MRFQSFPIDSKRLRELRKSRGLTQVEMALRICDKLDLEQDEETATSVYRRIEKLGSTSKDRAQAIADILKVSLDDLQGLVPPEPATYGQRIFSLLKSQIDAGANPAILRAIKRFEEESPEDALKTIAGDISARIEGAQLCRNPAELAELAELTCLDPTELLRPANYSGHWLVSVVGAGIHSVQVLPGTFEFWMHLDMLLKDQLEFHGTDVRIELRRDSPWYRIEIELPKRRSFPRSLKLIRIDIVRCQPDADGIRWISPSWTEDWLITDHLESWAHHYGNFVQTFDVPLKPSDVSRLCLLVTEYQGSREKPTGQHLIRPQEGSFSPGIKSDAMEMGMTHQLIIRQLQPGLHDHLASILKDHPTGRWTLMEGYGGLALNFWPRPITADALYGLRYSIDLVEVVESAEFGHAPWRDRDRRAFREIVEKWLN